MSEEGDLVVESDGLGDIVVVSRRSSGDSEVDEVFTIKRYSSRKRKKLTNIQPSLPEGKDDDVDDTDGVAKDEEDEELSGSRAK